VVARALGACGERRGIGSGGLPSWVGRDGALALRRVRAEGRGMESTAGWQSDEEAVSSTAVEAAKCVGVLVSPEEAAVVGCLDGAAQWLRQWRLSAVAAVVVLPKHRARCMQLGCSCSRRKPMAAASLDVALPVGGVTQELPLVALWSPGENPVFLDERRRRLWRRSLPRGVDS
jgi:hypothetical protein